VLNRHRLVENEAENSDEDEDENEEDSDDLHDEISLEDRRASRNQDSSLTGASTKRVRFRYGLPV